MANKPCASCLSLVCKCKPEREFLVPEPDCLISDGIYQNVTITLKDCKIIEMVDSDNQPINLCDSCR